MISLPAQPVPEPVGSEHTLPLDDHDLLILRNVDQSLAESIALKKWFSEVSARQGFARQFNLIRSFNRPTRGTGFFDKVNLGGHDVEVMGVLQDMLFDRADTGASAVLPAIRHELREFILQYFMRISDFQAPEVAVDNEPPEGRSPFGWCCPNAASWQGFGYSQLYYKLSGSGRVGKFAEDLRYAIVDLREMGKTFEWIVMKVRILDFNLGFRPFGPDLPALSIPLHEQTYLILHKDFISNIDGTGSGPYGEYGFGYGLLRVDEERESFLAYGPGHFGSGFQTINFQMLQDGTTSVKTVFVVNRPERLVNVPLDPLEWGFAFADVASLGTASRVFAPVKSFLRGFIPSFGVFDPLLTYVSAANLLTGGEAARRLCISKEHLEKQMLIQHFMQHYDMIVGSLLTWRQIPDWLEPANLPDWVLHGRQP